tara:strand:- start:427 stop:870 length:444 start_codon:yes stop_codon:yes gene_type:complete
MTNHWGPPIWTLFHTLAARVNSDKYLVIAQELFGFIKRICSLLPCPECQEHSIHYIRTCGYDVTTKNNLIHFLFTFHNEVNKRKGKEIEPETIVNKYHEQDLSVAYNNFVRAFTMKTSPRLMGDTLHRQRLIQEFKVWLMKYRELFF